MSSVRCGPDERGVRRARGGRGDVGARTCVAYIRPRVACCVGSTDIDHTPCGERCVCEEGNPAPECLAIERHEEVLESPLERERRDHFRFELDEGLVV